MSSAMDQEILKALKAFDTPSITNAVATYPDNPNCLGLYQPWTENWYTDQTIRCVYPDLGSTVGYAVTCVFGLPNPSFTRLSFMDVIDALEATRKPSILVLQQKFPEEQSRKVGLVGSLMVTAMKSMGCVGLVSNGPSRDVDDIRSKGFQMMLTGTSAGHGGFAVHSVNTPVSVGAMDVAPGEIVHMDENGACKFPASKLAAVHDNVKALLKREQTTLGVLEKAKTAEEIKAAFRSHAYSK